MHRGRKRRLKWGSHRDFFYLEQGYSPGATACSESLKVGGFKKSHRHATLIKQIKAVGYRLDLENTVRHPRLVAFFRPFTIAFTQLKGIAIGYQIAAERRFYGVLHPFDRIPAAGAGKLFLQPEWSKSKEMTPLIVEYVMNNPQWEISLQTHKYLNIP